MNTFEKKMEELATQELGDHYYPFWRGARWARSETITEVLQLLKSEQGEKVLRNYCPSNTVRWLEEKLQGEIK